ncbi:MAG: DUF4157 domain-containing protein [Rhizonema sp. NSF051]|nr:DUF4157 domain-containing protein [Rhizonema sp. NSF051]
MKYSQAKQLSSTKSQKKHSPIVLPLVEQQTLADSQLSPKVKLSRIPSKEEREAIKRKVFETIERTAENQAKREGLSNQVVRVEKTPDFASIKGKPIQPKLTIGAPGDKYEQEADRVAAQVVNFLNAPVTQQKSQNLQREAIPEEEKLQMKPMKQLQAGVGGVAASPDLESSIQHARSGGQPLADHVRKPMEQAFGADFSGVRVHNDRQSDQLNQSIQARAFTTGQDVFFRSGEYNPGNRGGLELIAHELTHVVQQKEGAVRRQEKAAGKRVRIEEQAKHAIRSQGEGRGEIIQRYIRAGEFYLDDNFKDELDHVLQNLSENTFSAINYYDQDPFTTLEFTTGHCDDDQGETLFYANIQGAWRDLDSLTAPLGNQLTLSTPIKIKVVVDNTWHGGVGQHDLSATLAHEITVHAINAFDWLADLREGRLENGLAIARWNNETSPGMWLDPDVEHAIFGAGLNQDYNETIELIHNSFTDPAKRVNFLQDAQDDMFVNT